MSVVRTTDRGRIDGDRVYALRKRSGLSRKELELRGGPSTAHQRRIEREGADVGKLALDAYATAYHADPVLLRGYFRGSIKIDEMVARLA